MDVDHQARLAWLCGLIEAELLRVGGSALLAAARTQAERDVARLHPVTGLSEDSANRLSTRLTVLTTFLESFDHETGQEELP